MKYVFLKFPPLLGGNGDFTAYLVLFIIVALVVGVGVFVYRMLQQERD